MTDDTNQTPIAAGDVLDDEIDDGPTEIQILKDKATMLGIQYSPNIGVDTLRARIDAKLNENEPETSDPIMDATNATVATPEPGEIAAPAKGKFYTEEQCVAMTIEQIRLLPEKVKTRVIRTRQRKEHLALIRCQIFCNNPKKNDLRGEIITVGNKYVGTVRKMVPFGEATENGYHIQKILFEALKRRKYQKITVVKRQDGTEEVKTQLVPEYTLNVLPPLTQDELDELALRQTAAARVGLA